MREDYFTSDKFKQDVDKLINKINLSDEFYLIPIKRGRNNRVFCVNIKGWGKALLKAYFKHPKDPRDRLRNEFSFSNFAWDKGLRGLHKPYACDCENNLGLYQFIEGRKITPDEVNREFVDQALAFFIELNKHKDSPEAKKLPNASEACFSINGHLDTVKRRIDRLKMINGSSEVDREAISFVDNELLGGWNGVFLNAKQLIDDYDLDPNEEIHFFDRCLSPSDFGFHNAIVDKERRLFFVDFEYAGWDDPSKMICDFFCQPEVPVSLDYYGSFIEAVFRADLSEKNIKKTNLLLPVYRIKWCCIMLNEFLRYDSERRNFSQADVNIEKRKSEQLEKARVYLRSATKEKILF